MNEQELKTVLELHKKWLEGKEEGKRANLRKSNLLWADLREADLQGADLQGADLQGADLRDTDLRGADLREADLRGVDLRKSNLRDADFRRADLREADLDYSVWPLWCGGLHVKTDKRIMAQLAYHFCAQDCDDTEYIKARNAILWFANQFHLANECGILEEIAEKEVEDGQ